MLSKIAHSGTDVEMIGRSVNTDNSMSKFKRKDGSQIKESALHQTKNFAPKEFNKHTFGKSITLKYNNTKFRPVYIDEGSSPPRSTLGALKFDESSTILDG